MGRKPISKLVEKRLYKEANSQCPRCEQADVATLQVHHIEPVAEGGSDDEENLIVLCSNCHSKVTAGEITEAEILRLKISLMKGTSPRASKNTNGKVVNFMGGANSGIIANEVTMKTQKKTVRVNPPPGSIGSSLAHRNYIKHLIDRYHGFKEAEIGKERMNHPIFYGTIKRKFGAKWDMIALERFDELSIYIQTRIDKTRLGRNKKAKNVRRYSPFPEHQEKPRRSD